MTSRSSFDHLVPEEVGKVVAWRLVDAADALAADGDASPTTSRT